MTDEEMLEAIADVMKEMDETSADPTLEAKTRQRAATAYEHLDKAYAAIISLGNM